eukprot:TRINITY_DN852_c0_g1_i1.p1 TRINITY_DN852_c0_g1~~TRINITY_DN852_c0_g1_i1.p1  ORF type:complete len:353 (-),score=163.83 TRINITY_DN852_c0_g1_i1:75-1133(-)
MFDLAGINYIVMETQHNGHAKEIGKSLNLSEFRGAVTVSGDGLLYELLNGLLEREDRENVVKLPLGIIPGGTGNGLAAALNAANPIAATLAIIKGSTRLLDILEIRVCQNGENNTQKINKLYSFLQVSWGFVSDLEFMSENFRWLGPARTNFAGVYQIFAGDKHRAKISFYPLYNMDVNSTFPPTLYQTQCGTKCICCKTNKITSLSNSVKDVSYQITPTRIIEDNQEGVAPRVIECDINFFMACNTAWADQNTFMAPWAHTNDGAIDLVIVRSGPSKLEFLTIMPKIEYGTHITAPFLEYYKVKRFKIEPISIEQQTGKEKLDIDGELMYMYWIEGVIRPGLCSIFCLDQL